MRRSLDRKKVEEPQPLGLLEEGSEGKRFIVVFAGGTDMSGKTAHVAQMVERVLGKDEVISSILIMGSS